MVWLDRIHTNTIALVGVMVFLSLLMFDNIGFKFLATTLVGWLTMGCCSTGEFI
ncbi:hypothetical protein P886_1012 [Alteromonadaceae bacterium 2753L.S.0a.02]|nr:hypothetical protein P886_1012 [Alteromonadaceae bacterium 2753L.S.0a.02]